jgi:hypothetical protein
MMSSVPQLVGDGNFSKKPVFPLKLIVFVPAGSVSLEADRVNV